MRLTDGVALGDSVAVNGVCLTVVAFDARTMRFDVVPETVARTGSTACAPATALNVELSLRSATAWAAISSTVMSTRTRRSSRRNPRDKAFVCTSCCPTRSHRSSSRKGYVAVDGVSLTVASVTPNLHDRADPGNGAPDDARHKGRRRPREPGDRSDRALRARRDRRVRATRLAPTADEVAWAYEI